MKTIYLLLLIVYFGGLLFLYVNLPEKEIQEEGSFNFYSCYEYDCAQIFLDLNNLSSNKKCAFYDLDEPRMLTYFKEDDANLLLYKDNNDYNLGTSVKINGLMHHKFCVFDDYLTLTGSWNPTLRGTELNDNYVALINSKIVARKFLDEYIRLDNKVEQGTKSLKMKLSNMSVTLCFSPRNNCGDLIVDEINKANTSVKMLAFSFTDKSIADALIDAQKKGVNVNVMFEKTRISKYSMFYYLNNSNVSVCLDNNPYTMHEKLILIDNTSLIVGSYNPSTSAEDNNDENLVIINGISKDIFDKVDKEILRLWQVA
ncbi:hypothetical protein JXA48_00725 [Candidatus Woesearchaeota archaeon]|nr:hypothetical protein [Candidatus Woesearchaeota archaeon]